jgi:hypothetical protein
LATQPPVFAGIHVTESKFRLLHCPEV